ncbi:MAG: ABC transporter permease [Bryobacterales bacterium]|nr:ABC transporter permease [Bryobacterales bacterium]
MFRYLPLVVKNCWRNRRRTTLTIVSIGASLCLLGVLMAIYHAFYFSDPPPEQALRLVTRNRVSLTFQMPQAYREQIKQIPGVREVMISQWFGGKYKDSRPENMFARFASEPDRLFTIHGEMKVPEDQKKAFQRERSACLVGKALADKYGWKLGDKITIVGDIFPMNLELTIRAIYEAGIGNETLYFNREYLEESLPVRRRGFAGTFNILADSPESVPRIASALDARFRNSSAAETKTEAEQAFQLGFVSALGNVKLFLLSICAAVTFTIMLVSANTMAMSVRERVKEVGVLRTLGFTPGAILGMILSEAVAISVIGGIIGCGLASVLCGAVRSAPVFIQQLKTLSLAPSVAAACVGVAAVIGLVSAAVPAWSASRTPIVEALRASD